MPKDDLRDLLSKIRDLLDKALESSEPDESEPSGSDWLNDLSCVQMELEEELQSDALVNAIQMNPANRPGRRTMEALAAGTLTPMEAAVERTRYWGPTARTFPVSFMDLGDPALEKRIVKQMNEWHRHCDYQFKWTRDVGICRVSVNVPKGTYSSLVGTDNKFVGNPPQATMKLYAPGWLETNNPSEFRRLILHESGHFLGMTHEHLRKEIVSNIDKQKAYRYYWSHYQWSKDKVDQNVLTPIDISQYYSTPYDPDSVEHYMFPGEIMKDGKAVKGGNVPSDLDIIMVAALCPKQDGQLDAALAAAVTRVAKERKRKQPAVHELAAAPGVAGGGTWDAFDDVLGVA